MEMIMRVYSAFNGYSGANVALDRADKKVTTYLASETDKWCNAVTRYNYPKTVFIGDITKVNPNSIKDIDLMIGGSPCQDLSFSGKGKGLVEGKRSNLFFTWLDHLKEIKPKYFLLENVKMKKEYENMITMALGVAPMMIPSSLVSGQKRDRLYWFNWHCDLPKDKKIFLQDIVEDGAVDRDKSFCIDANYWKGGNLRTYFEKSRRQLVFKDGCQQVGVADLNGHDILKRVYSVEGKSPTLNTCGGGNREPKILCKSASVKGRRIDQDGIRKDNDKSIPLVQTLEVYDNDKSRCLSTVDKDAVVSPLPVGRYPHAYTDSALQWRKLTVRECCRLQTLPDDYCKSVSNSQGYKILGNGWTNEVIKFILKGKANESK